MLEEANASGGYPYGGFGGGFLIIFIVILLIVLLPGVWFGYR